MANPAIAWRGPEREIDAVTHGHPGAKFKLFPPEKILDRGGSQYECIQIARREASPPPRHAIRRVVLGPLNQIRSAISGPI